MVNNYHGEANNRVHSFITADLRLLDMWFKSAFIPKEQQFSGKHGNSGRLQQSKFFFHLFSNVLWDTFHCKHPGPSLKRTLKYNYKAVTHIKEIR